MKNIGNHGFFTEKGDNHVISNPGAEPTIRSHRKTPFTNAIYFDFFQVLEYFCTNLMKQQLTIILFFVFLLIPKTLPGQISSIFDTQQSDTTLNESKQKSPTQQKQFSLIVAAIERSIQSTSTDELTGYFAKKVSLNLPGNVDGIYSANQAYYIIEKFFTNHRFSNIQLIDQRSEYDELFASGSGIMLTRGKRQAIKVYIGFDVINNSFQISQLTIY